MSDRKPTYEELASRLAEAQDLIQALQDGEVDAVVCSRDVSFVRPLEHEQRTRRYNAELERRVAERTRQLRELTLQLTQTEHRERRRLAALLHDHVQQLIAGAKLRLGSLRPALDGEELARLRKVDDLLSRAIEATRSLSMEIGPPDVHEAGFEPGLRWMARHMQELHGLTVDVEYPARVRVEDDDLRILLVQSVRELLFNVVKHSSVRHATVRVEHTGNDTIRIQVRDRGHGFDVLSMPLESSGTGYGLFSVRERLEVIGGAMDVRSVPGRGTTVTITAPRDLDGTPDRSTPSTPPPSPLPAAPPEPSTSGRRPLRVLIADDHQLFREGLVSLLGDVPELEIVGEAGDGRSAVDRARTLRPDAVVMDVSMPVMNGIDATRAIRTAHPATRVVGLTMHYDVQTCSRMRDAGASACLTKDGPQDLLIAALLS